MIALDCLEQKSNLKYPIDTFKYKLQFAREHPFYFYPCGFTCFIGEQGGGKSLAAVLYVIKLLNQYPKSILVTNIDIEDYPVDNTRIFRFTCAEDLLVYRNGEYGVIFLIDEIHLYLGSQKGANNLNPEVLQAICQQRKQRVHIVSTSQFFAQLNINLRRHFDHIILCESKLFGYRQKLSLINRDSIASSESSSQTMTGEVKKVVKYWRHPSMFKKYDTYAVINGNLAVGLEREVSNYDNREFRLSNSGELVSAISSISSSNRNNI